MIGVAFAMAALVLAALPAIVYFGNRRHFRRLPVAGDGRAAAEEPISVLIPARNEEATIERCLRSVLANEGATFEVILLDDNSTDRTAEIVSNLAAGDPRLRMLTGRELPASWCGKQHACWQLAQAAQYDRLLFLDADVELSSDALTRLSTEFSRRNVALLSGFPREQTGSWFEHLMLPLIHYILLGYLPIWRMRESTDPMYSAGCGQLMLVDRAAYDACGGHASIRASLHDGLKLVRQFRRHGFATDLFAADDIARCRMYHNAREVWSGFGKNATEGMANAPLIYVFTFLLCGSSILPLVLLTVGLPGGLSVAATAIAALATVLSVTPRLCMVADHGHRFFAALLHPVAVMLFLVIQWTAFISSWRGGTVQWKGRLYPASQAGEMAAPSDSFPTGA